ncbi:hypothetical protein [Pseudomonas sp. TCU-HL1]|uniref:hypothetical protein n=1 Tax=Pseudomonas sp. TCU-HL1 TaxID=1856685 RepID=UPI00083DFD2C|nr:hypothetical protein [Pseudomonas sp. TCU-HL1]AOE86997.1 hypothetical protein THL1_4449 [Pseudomonas sp. TCU-HL1]
MPKLSVISAVVALTFSSLASAGWMTTTQDDIFSGGQKAMLIGEVDPFHALVFDCDSERLALSLIEKSKWQEGMELASYRLLVKVDQGAIYDFAAKGSQRNEQYVQSSTADRDKILGLLKEIRDAQAQIQIGLQITETGSKWSGTSSVAGSTREADRFLQACNLK